MKFKKNFSLKHLNTFGINVKSELFYELIDINDLPALLKKVKSENLRYFILGGGSNVLFIDDFNGLVIRIALKGIELIDKNDKYVHVKAMAGENWEDFVSFCVHNDWGGIENLTLIPGNVGTSPMQNIGAYGVEIKDTFIDLQALELETGKIRTFTKEDCQFGYRDSFFKNKGNGKYLIMSVTLRLTRKEHVINTTYGSVSEEIEKQGIKQPGLSDVMETIRRIRRIKLPDPAEIGNAGSFFKNPVLDAGHFQKLKNDYPKIPGFPAESGRIKTAAGWLIEKDGWKGHREGDAGVHDKQALVLVNHGNASGRAILSLAQKIKKSVENRFGVSLEMEVNIIDGKI
ncbi:MAG: UDP-N-acetylmuramate dehydrogenase [Bacteroidetes bacterium]|nr:MAG: UDP-N-acetylmuramate dehydrogenase [Bacteroidota bacterium]